MIVTPEWARPKMPKGTHFEGSILVSTHKLTPEEFIAIRERWYQEYAGRASYSLCVLPPDPGREYRP